MPADLERTTCCLAIVYHLEKEISATMDFLARLKVVYECCRRGVARWWVSVEGGGLGSSCRWILGDVTIPARTYQTITSGSYHSKKQMLANINFFAPSRVVHEF